MGSFCSCTSDLELFGLVDSQGKDVRGEVERV